MSSNVFFRPHRSVALLVVTFAVLHLSLATAHAGTPIAIQRSLLPISKPRIRGVALEQHLFRAADGSIYQLIRAVPEAVPLDADAWVVTQVAAGVNGLDYCGSTTREGGGAALVGADSSSGQVLHQEQAIQRTAIFSPNDISTVEFDEGGSGRLTVGRGVRPIRICGDPSTCRDPAPLVPFTQRADDGVSGCLANGVVAVCGGQFQFLSTFGFRTSSDATDSCATTPATNVALCVAPPDGLRLEAGDAIVLVFHSDLRFHDFTTAVAAFAVNEDGNNSASCPPGTVVAAGALTGTIPSRLP